MPNCSKRIYRQPRRTLLLLAMSMLAAVAPTQAFAAEDRIGRFEYYQIRGQKNLLQVARLNGLGYVELLAANPGINPWVPEIGRTLILPKAHLLPDAPRRGIVINLADV